MVGDGGSPALVLDDAGQLVGVVCMVDLERVARWAVRRP
jgi:hypothetical protein